MKKQQLTTSRAHLSTFRKSTRPGNVDFFVGLLFLSFVIITLSPGASADDEFPRGCVSCHVVLGNGEDKRLSAVLAEIGHVSLQGRVARVPTDCIACHDKKGDTPFSVVIHKAHFGTPDKNVFVQRFGGDCRACHVMDATTGEAKLKEGDIDL